MDDQVQLPHGTDVVTSVARDVDGRSVPQGAAGRVVGSGDHWVDLQVPGIGVVRYARAEVTPYRSGQIRYAIERDELWKALHRNVVIEAVVGSHAWGLADENSDVDYRGAFVLPFSWTARLGRLPEDLVSADGSSVYWEAQKVITNALRNDPNTLELLFLPTAKASHRLGELILAERHAFASRRIYASFGQYALSQLKKLKRSLRLSEHRDLLLGWIRQDPALSLDIAAECLAQDAGIVAPTMAQATLQAKEYIKALYGSLCDTGVLSEKSWAALVAFALEDPGALEPARRLRPKNAYNLLRLLVTATGWLRDGSPTFEMTGAVRDELLSIKRGDVDMERVVERAEELSRDLEEAYRTTKLPERPDMARAQHLLLRLRYEASQAWVYTGDEFGLNAAPVPVPKWEG